MSSTVVVPTWNGAGRIGELLASLEGQAEQVIVVDNGSEDGTAELVGRHFSWVELLPLERNTGFSHAVNVAARGARGDALVLVNDDCVCEPEFVARITAPLDAAQGVVMVAGVLVEAGRPAVVDTAGMELDRTLLVFDYLNGLPVAELDSPTPTPTPVPVPVPIGPSGAASAFDRDAFLAVGGFDERLFAYWEDVDLVLRLRERGGRCAFAPTARGRHAHSGTLGSGSAEKNYLTGFGRGYVLRKWSVLTPRRVLWVLARELAICVGQLVVDRTLAGARGRVAGLRAGGLAERHAYPTEVRALGGGSGLVRTLIRRRRRRSRLRSSEEAVDAG